MTQDKRIPLKLHLLLAASLLCGLLGLCCLALALWGPLVAVSAPLAGLMVGLSALCMVLYLLALYDHSLRRAPLAKAAALPAEALGSAPVVFLPTDPREVLTVGLAAVAAVEQTVLEVDEPAVEESPSLALRKISRTIREEAIPQHILQHEARAREAVVGEAFPAVEEIPDHVVRVGMHDPEEDPSTSEMDFAAFRNLVSQHSGEHAALSMDVVLPASRFQTGEQILASWSDGERYPCTIAQVHGERCLCRFDDGQEHWLSEEDLSYT